MFRNHVWAYLVTIGLFAACTSNSGSPSDIGIDQPELEDVSGDLALDRRSPEDLVVPDISLPDSSDTLVPEDTLATDLLDSVSDLGEDVEGDVADAVPDVVVELHAVPPPPPDPTPGDGTSSVTFALSRMYLGDTLPDGTPAQATGWKHFGYDLDGLLSTEASTNLCKPMLGANAKFVYPDGNDGIDNSFGKNVLPIFFGLVANAGQAVNDAIMAGAVTTLIDVAKLGTGDNYNPLFATLYEGADLGAAAKFDGTDTWPVAAGSLADPDDLATALTQAPESYLVNRTWVSGPIGDVPIVLYLGAFRIRLILHQAVITMVLAPDLKEASSGIIAGILSVEEFNEQMRQFAGSFDPSLCSGPTLDSIVAQISQAADIMLDASQDPSKTCDGISIGLGFDARRVQLGSITPDVPFVNPCGD